MYKKSHGCKKQTLIDSVILEQATSKKRNIYAEFIDYKKSIRFCSTFLAFSFKQNWSYYSKSSPTIKLTISLQIKIMNKKEHQINPY